MGPCASVLFFVARLLGTMWGKVERGVAMSYLYRRLSMAASICADWAGLDVRSLAIFRIALAMQQLIDQCIDAPSHAVFLTDDGVLPRSVTTKHYSSAHWSLHAVHGGAALYNVLSIVHIGVLLALLLGWHTRTSTAAAYLLRVSQCNRNEMILSAFDGSLACALLFWGVWLPLGDVWSMDALRQRLAPLTHHGGEVVLRRRAAMPSARTVRPVLSVASIALQVQMWVVYFSAMYAKTSSVWTRDHTAVQLMLQHSFASQRRASLWLLRQEALCRLLTAMTAPVEYVLPLMLLLPSPPRVQLYLRVPALAGLMGFHCAICILLALHATSYVNMVSLLPFMPVGVWPAPASIALSKQPGAVHVSDRQEQDENESEPMLHTTAAVTSDSLTDGTRDVDTLGATTIELRAPLSAMPALTLALACEIACLFDPRRIYRLRSAAVSEGCRQDRIAVSAVPTHSSQPVKALCAWHDAARGASRGGLPIAHNLIAAIACAVGPIGRHLLRGVRDLALLWLITTVVWHNLADVGVLKKASSSSAPRFQAILSPPRWLRMRQSFRVFAPAPLPFDVHTVLAGQLSDGRQVDVMGALRQHMIGQAFNTSNPLRWERPQCVDCGYPSYAWRKYFYALKKGCTQKPLYEAQCRSFGQWICRTWNSQAGHSTSLTKFSLVFIVYDNRRLVAPNQSLPQHSNRTYWSVNCLKKPAAPAARPRRGAEGGPRKARPGAATATVGASKPSRSTGRGRRQHGSRGRARLQIQLNHV